MTRVILHVDMDAFFTSVEQLDHPELRGRPVVVGAAADARGVVAAASYEARRFGVHSAMPSRTAARLCPEAVFVPPRMRRYAEVSAQVFRIFERFTPLVEPLSVDEAFLDVTGAERLHGDGATIAAKIKAAIRAETGLSASVGVASNKLLAKLASDLQKPDGLTVVPTNPGAVRTFLAPLAVGRLWGVGPVTRQQLEGVGVRTIGDLQGLPVARLAQLVGRHSADLLHRLAWGEDDRPVETEQEEKSISREHTFPTDCRNRVVVAAMLDELVEDVGRQLREAGWLAGVVRLKLRWSGFETLTRQRALEAPCCDDFSLRREAQGLFAAQRLVKPVRLVGFGAAGLTREGATQLALFEPDRQSRQETVSRTVDHIRKQFGGASIRRAGALPPGRPPPQDPAKGEGFPI